MPCIGGAFASCNKHKISNNSNKEKPSCVVDMKDGKQYVLDACATDGQAALDAASEEIGLYIPDVGMLPFFTCKTKKTWYNRHKKNRMRDSCEHA